MRTWSLLDKLILHGTKAVVTESAVGVGFEVALQLARAGADVVLTSRNEARAGKALQGLHIAAPMAKRSLYTLALANPQSVARFSDAMLREGTPTNILVHNAERVPGPRRQITSHGLEQQFARNYEATVR